MPSASSSSRLSRLPEAPTTKESSFLDLWMDDTEQMLPRRVHANGDYEDMGELSDSPSSLSSHSRPATPSESIIISRENRSRRRSSSASVQPTSSPGSDGPLALPQKAERILGLLPGTLPHARACLENARDEVRRTAPAATSGAEGTNTISKGGVKGRAAKALSVIMLQGSKVPGVVLGAGGEEEESKREKRRRAADGVLHWQREVARLESEAQEVAHTVRRRR